MRVRWPSARLPWELNTARSDSSLDPGNPNAGLNPEVISKGVGLIQSVFHQEGARIESLPFDGPGRTGFILGRAGDTLHLAFVRVTVEDEEVEEGGTAPIPGILIDASLAMGAEPHLVRVHVRRRGGHTFVSSFGAEELARALRESMPQFKRELLGGRTVGECLRLVRGRLSRLALKLVVEPPGEWPRREIEDSPEWKAVEEIFKSVPQEPPGKFPGRVSVKVEVDTLPPAMFCHHVSLGDLARSAAESGELEIFTCSCGMAPCAGIWRGVQVVHEDGLVVWRIRGIAPRRLVVFNRAQYRCEILTTLHDVLATHDAMGPEAIIDAGRAEYIREVLVWAGAEHSG